MAGPRLGRPALAAGVVAGLVAGLTAGLVALAGGAGPAGAAAAAPPPPLSFLHVGPAAGPAGLPQILDGEGREVMLRGVNVNGLEDYWQDSSTPLAVPYPSDPAAYAGGRCPSRDPAVESMALCALDAPQLHAFGYDSVRLAVSWSLLEPTPGRIDPRYVDRIAQAVGWLAGQGIYSILDLHQDAWSKYLYTPSGALCPPPFTGVSGFHESDGAPAWASAHDAPVCALHGVRELDAAVQEDFQRFWSDTAGPDGIGLQEHFAGVVRALAQRFHDNPAVAGYELFNEPSPGFMAPAVMDASELFPFYAKVIAAVTASSPGFRQLFFVEPDITRDVTDQSLIVAPWSVYSSYPNVVYAPHVYTRVFTPDADLNAAAGTPTFLPMSEGYASAVRDAKALGLPLWVGEFGNGVPDDPVQLAAHYTNQDGLGIGSSLWVWKADTSAQFSVEHGPFGVGAPFPSRVEFTDRAYPVATAGVLERLSYDPPSGDFTLVATSPAVRPGATDRATVLQVPPRSRGALVATGATVTVVSDGAGRIAYVYPTGGRYVVTLGSAAGGSGGAGGAGGSGGSGAVRAVGAGGPAGTLADTGGSWRTGAAGAALAGLGLAAFGLLARRRRPHP
ncbi:MAG TPA: cellulase family glycosylhydrolase [Mycobacteriales bacterium]|nr:cellulase family glycosylhydrolase [Mycobacteriales bacterium]